MRATQIRLAYPSAVARLTAIKKAAYRFSDKLIVDFAEIGSDVECVITSRQDIESSEFERLVGDFKIEVLDNDLREIVASETEVMRNAILAYAFSKTGLQSTE